MKPDRNRKAQNDIDVFDGSGEPAAKREALPTNVNVDGFGQCIAVLTSGGDAQGRTK